MPGAFTPTCSSTHLPRYNDLAHIFKENGIDDIICISVNDTFVMEAWGVDQESENIRLLPDGNGEFSEGMGMLVDKSDLGFGKRSWRYSMFVDNGVIKKMFIEPDKPGDPFEVSDADTMLKYINSNVKITEGATIFTKENCSFCKSAKKQLNEHGIKFTEIHGIRSKALKSMGGSGTYPLIFIDKQLIGGTKELEEYFSKS